MTIRTIKLGMTLLLFGLMDTRPSAGQIVSRAAFGFEHLGWGDNPSYIRDLFGLTWIRTYTKQENRNLGSGRSDVFSLKAAMTEMGVDIYVQFEFSEVDSGLVCVTMLAGGLPGMYEVSEEFVDHVWDMNLDRFGEPTGGKWIPLLGESSEWTIGNVYIKMIRMNLPTSGVLIKYVLQEN